MLLLAATIIAALVYVLMLNEHYDEHQENGDAGSSSSNSHNHHTTHIHRPNIDAGTSFGDNDELQQQERTAINFLNRYNGISRNTIQTSSVTSTPSSTLVNNGDDIDAIKSITTARSISVSTTPKTPSKYLKTMIYTNVDETRRHKSPPKSPPHTTLLLNTHDHADENIVDRTKLLFPTKETLEIFGFTSGHQNNFGVPIEEDERILRMLNAEMLNSQRKANKSGKSDTPIVSTTDLNMYRTKVSPTLPILNKIATTTTERIRSLNATEDGKSQRNPLSHPLSTRR